MAARTSPHRDAFDKLSIKSFEELPHERADAVGIRGLTLSDLGTPTTAAEDQHWDLLVGGETTDQYRRLRALLVRYVAEVLPYPVELQGYWRLTALPATAGGRVFTLSVRGTDAFFARLTEGDLWLILRERKGSRRELAALGGDHAFLTVPYASLRSLRTIGYACPEFDTIETVFDTPDFLDDAYAVCRTLMIHGSGARKLDYPGHNASFAADVLLTAYRNTSSLHR